MSPAKEKSENVVGAILSGGFPLQMALANAVRKTEQQHHWEVAASEFGWTDEDGRMDFADLLLSKGKHRLVVEAKKWDAKLAFLRPSVPEPQATTRCFLRWRRLKNLGALPIYSGDWYPFHVSPPSPEAEFCQTFGHTGLLEAEGGQLARAVEGIVGTTDEVVLHGQDLKHQIFAPVFVTTAEILICDVPADQIAVATGTINGSLLRPVSCPFVRFTKAFGPYPGSKSRAAQTLKVLHEMSQRTVFVVSAAYFIEFLSSWSYHQSDDNPPWWSASGDL